MADLRVELRSIIADTPLCLCTPGQQNQRALPCVAAKRDKHICQHWKVEEKSREEMEHTSSAVMAAESVQFLIIQALGPCGVLTVSLLLTLQGKTNEKTTFKGR